MTLIVAFAVALGMSSLTTGTVRTSINATYGNSTFSGTEQALTNYIGVMDTFTEIVGPLLVILLFLWLVIIIWKFRRFKQ